MKQEDMSGKTSVEALIEEYEQQERDVEASLHEVRKRILWISVWRVALFVLMAVALVVYIVAGMHAACLWAMFVCLLLFLGGVKRHDVWYRRKHRLEVEQALCRLNVQNLRGDFSAHDGGKEFVNPDHLYSYDLDLFGERSLFQAFNRTCTDVGRSRLAAWMKKHLTACDSIERRQELLRAMASRPELLRQFQVACMVAAGEAEGREDVRPGMARLMLNEHDWQVWATGCDTFLGKWYYKCLPVGALVVNLLLVSAAFLEAIPYSLAGLCFAAMAVLGMRYSRKVTALQQDYTVRLQSLSRCAPIFAWMEQEKGLHGAAWGEVTAKFSVDRRKASEAIAVLRRLMDALDRRNNVLMLFLLNGLCFWELYRIMAVEKWKKTYAPAIPSWIEGLALCDVYVALALYVRFHPDYSFPEVVREVDGAGFLYEAEALGHPLMNPRTRVDNPAELKGRPHFLIVTGANMAGKSTYLRTVAVNFLMACMGMPVCGRGVRITPVMLVTSLRTADSLADNESYFFAELKRLKLIIDLLQEGKRLFVILDEILRGTNSVDKQKGSLALLEQLIRLEADGIIATHDLQLGQLADRYPGLAENCCFEADIEEDDLSFSYRLRKGIARNMNACFLMRKMGIAIPE